MILVASARAAQALARARGHAPLPEVWAVGPATAAALQAAGIPALQPAAAIDASTLAAALLGARALVGKKVLVPRADEGRDEAITMLRAAGALVDDIAAYRTVPISADDAELAVPRSLLVTGKVAVCAVFAPSQVTALARLLGSLAALPTRFVAIGETTAAALHAAGVSEVGVADRPTPEGLANAVAAVYPPDVMNYPDYRPRRMRRTEGLRRMVRETRLSVGRLRLSAVRRPGLRASRSRSARCPGSSTTPSTRRPTPHAARPTSASPP